MVALDVQTPRAAARLVAVGAQQLPAVAADVALAAVVAQQPVQVVAAAVVVVAADCRQGCKACRS
jgi:hypothetical protein